MGTLRELRERRDDYERTKFVLEFATNALGRAQKCLEEAGEMSLASKVSSFRTRTRERREHWLEKELAVRRRIDAELDKAKAKKAAKAK